MQFDDLINFTISDCNGIQTQNRLVCIRTRNHLAKLAC